MQLDTLFFSCTLDNDEDNNTLLSSTYLLLLSERSTGLHQRLQPRQSTEKKKTPSITLGLLLFAGTKFSGLKKIMHFAGTNISEIFKITLPFIQIFFDKIMLAGTIFSENWANR